MNPYETLGIKEDATAEAIQARYRKKAMETHPDMPGGSPEAFHDVQRARLVLLDPGLRKAFDATGMMPDSNEAQLMAAAMNLVQETFLHILMQNDPSQITRTDIIATIGAHFDGAIATLEGELRKNGSKRIVFEAHQAAVCKRIKKKKKSAHNVDIFTNAMKTAILSVDAEERRIQGQLLVVKQALLLLNDYHCAADTTLDIGNVMRAWMRSGT